MKLASFFLTGVLGGSKNLTTEPMTYYTENFVEMTNFIPDPKVKIGYEMSYERIFKVFLIKK